MNNVIFMEFQTGNQFWKLRSKHGRNKLFETPELLWQAAIEYFEYTDKRVWSKKDWVGKDAMEVSRDVTTPYTLSGFCIYCNASREWWYKFKEQANGDFLHIITQIEEIIYTQKFEGATVGIFNANIIARDLGLIEKTDANIKQDNTISFKWVEVPMKDRNTNDN